MQISKRVIVGLAMVMVILAGCSGAGGTLGVKDAWARPVTAGGTGGMFFVVENDTGSADTLLSVTSDAARVVEMHKTEMDGGVMKMLPQPNVPIPAGKTEFKPGGLHLMLIEVKQELKAGDKISATLKFEKAGEVTVTAEVKAQ